MAGGMRLSHDPLNQAELRRAFAEYPSGVVVLAAERAGRIRSIVASTFTVGVSLEPPLVSLAVMKSSESWPELRKAERLGASILSRDQGDLCRQLSSKDRASRFRGVEVHTENGCIYLNDATAWLECGLYGEYEAGDHILSLLEVRAAHVNEVEPLVWHASGFRSLASPVARSA